MAPPGRTPPAPPHVRRTCTFRWEAVVAVAGVTGVDGRTLATDGQYRLRPDAVLLDPRRRPVGRLHALYFAGDLLRAAGIMHGPATLAARMIDGTLRPLLEMQQGAYTLRGDQILFRTGTVTAVAMDGQSPPWPQARFDTVRQVSR